MKPFWTPILCALLTAFLAAPSWAGDTIITNPKRSNLDKRFDYPVELLKQALAITEEEFGKTDVQPYPGVLPRKRA